MGVGETIILNDFVKDIIDSLKLPIEAPNKTVVTKKICAECDEQYDESFTYCPIHGSINEELIIETVEDYSENVIKTVFSLIQNESNPDAEFLFIDYIESRMDPTSYCSYYIFQRISDEKYFYYESCDGKFLHNELEETAKIFIEIWDFEKID